MENQTFNKVAKITLIFWLMKIVATTLGETLGDFISQTLNLGYYVGISVTAILFLIFLAMQLSVKKYVPAVFWLVIIGTTTFGTEISDFIDRTLKIGYAGGSSILVTCLAVTLFLWYRKHRNLEVYPIFERSKEMYFWIAVLFSNSLGTAFGDFLGDNLGFSYFNGAVICGAIILVVVLMHYYTKINHILLFWIAFIFTRPFGATFGDFLTKPLAKGGLDLGTLNASVVSIIIISVLIFIAHRKHLQEGA
ncbi:hypothetical protein [Chryseobacterium sp. R2A-55]|uniref:COG4705 family protein n=1 Tax=Chryseobacterium sp. R2A-55 TaxID=2744445 RepID=UPI001F44F995|nr:hypothetical protein [Chryseobacterium sp. R2A-55]